jgi:hypothetical protein
MWNIFEKRQEIITIPFCLCFRCGNGYQWVHQYPSVDHVSSITIFTIHLLLFSSNSSQFFFSFLFVLSHAWLRATRVMLFFR